MASHDLRNPLAGIRRSARRLMRRAASSSKSVQTILDEADRLERLVSDLVDVTRVEIGQLDLKPHQVDLVSIAASAIEQAQAQTRLHTFQFIAPASPVEGRWDVDRLHQVLRNLLSNAIRYSPGGGEILIRLEDAGQSAQVSIQDHGLGIGAEALPRLFDRFYRAERTAGRAAGLGLGLAIVKGLIEAHGGRVWAESDGKGKGATFTFRLPRDRELVQVAAPLSLTRRQLKIARLIALGYSNQQIAQELGLTRGTVSNHVIHMLRRLGMNKRAEVAAWIAEHGLLVRDRES